MRSGGDFHDAGPLSVQDCAFLQLPTLQELLPPVEARDLRRDGGVSKVFRGCLHVLLQVSVAELGDPTLADIVLQLATSLSRFKSRFTTSMKLFASSTSREELERAFTSSITV